MYCIVSHIQPDIVGIIEDDPVGISQRCLVQNWLSHTEESTVVAFVTDLIHFALNDPYYSPYDVISDVIGNPHYSASYPYGPRVGARVTAKTRVTLGLRALTHLYGVIMTS